MQDMFHDKYRVSSTRVDWTDYECGIYFITICTAGKKHCFGEVEDYIEPRMVLSELGKHLEECWYDMPLHFPLVEPGPFVVMPNHLHGVVIMNDDNTATHDFTTQQSNVFGPQSRNLASVVRGLKVGVTKYARQHGIPFAWQPRYFEHIVRNQKDLNRITLYIEHNVTVWAMKGEEYEESWMENVELR